LLDRGEHGHYEGGEGGDDDDEGGSNMGSGSVISGTQNGCAVNFVDSLQAYFHCLQYSLGGQTVYLAYSIEQSGGKTIMNGAIVGPGVTSSTYIGIGSGSRMINTDAVIVSAISSCKFNCMYYYALM